MKKLFRRQKLIDEKRFDFAIAVVLIFSSILLTRIWYLQIFRGDYYRQLSENNRIRRIDVPAPRGFLYDRNGKVFLSNKSSFDLIYNRQYVQDRDKTVKAIADLLNIPIEVIQQRIDKYSQDPSYIPIIIKRNLSLHEVAKIESLKFFISGISISEFPIRDYTERPPSHLIGYLSEISREQIKSANETIAKDRPYEPGDLVGRHGLELAWENDLRGEHGYRYIQVDAHGRERPVLSHELQPLSGIPARKGSDLLLTIDSNLQKVADSAFAGKTGAVIALNPQTGEILAMVSEPEFDPRLFNNGIDYETWTNLLANPLKPLLDKTTGGVYPPGSIYKSVVAIAGIEEKLITPQTKYFCQGSMNFGSQVFHCHDRKGHGWVDLNTALMKSCDIFFYNVGLQLEVDRIAKYAKDLGLGSKLELGLNMEKTGVVPTREWKKKTYGQQWATGETLSLSIGQGYNAMTPLQMASLYSAISNGGKVWKPYVVSAVLDNKGTTRQSFAPQLLHQSQLISHHTFTLVKNALAQVVMNPAGTGHNAYVAGHEVAGKTGTVQVVSLSKYKKHSMVSSQWLEHAIFASFSPVENPEIAVLVLSEHDKLGGGGKAAAPVAQKILQAYYNLKELKQKGTATKENPMPANTGTNLEKPVDTDNSEISRTGSAHAEKPL